MAHFTLGATNAATEGITNLVKVVKRGAFGFRNFENFRRRVLIWVRVDPLLLRDLGLPYGGRQPLAHGRFGALLDSSGSTRVQDDETIMVGQPGWHDCDLAHP